VSAINNIIMLPVSKLYHHPDNPRIAYDDIEELSDSIRSMGILQNLTVVPYSAQDHGMVAVADPDDSYIVIIGNRRLEGAILAQQTEVPCAISNMSLVEQLATMDVENHLRQDTSPRKQAQNYQKMLDMGETVDTIAARTGFSTTTVRNRMTLLKLDADKFEKAEARGATMSEYLALTKISSIARRNTVLDAIGTKNFANALRNALDSEKNEKDFEKAVAFLASFAQKIDTIEGRTDLKEVQHYAWWYKSKLEVPADKDTVPYFYKVNGDIAYLYKEYHQTPEEAAAIRKEEKARQLRQKRAAERKDLAVRFFKLRKDFVSTITSAAAKKHLADVVEFQAEAVERLAATDYYGMKARMKPDVPTLHELLEHPSDDKELDMLVFSAMATKAPEYALLCLAYSMADCSELTYFYDRWDDVAKRYFPEYRANDTLDELYDFLAIFGYQMSEEELQFQNGTHPLFEREDEEASAA